MINITKGESRWWQEGFKNWLNLPGGHQYSSCTSCSSLPQGLCTCWLLCPKNSPQIFEWQVTLHSESSSNIISLKGLISHPTSWFFFPVFATVFSIFLYKAGHSVKLLYFLVQFCFPNGQYNVNAFTRNLSSLFTNVVLIPRTIPGTINKYSRQRFMKFPGSLKETCFEADYNIACSVRGKNSIWRCQSNGKTRAEK